MPSDFHYKRDVVLSDHLKSKNSKFPWYPRVSDSLELEIHNDAKLTTYSEAFSVHPTDELPLMLQLENSIGFEGGRQLEVLITPSVIRSDKNLKTLEPNDRSCYLEGERKLRFFKVYTKRNCEIECLANVSRKLCACGPGDIVGDPDTTVCGINIGVDDFQCLKKFQGDMKNLKPVEHLVACSCLPKCDLISYSNEVRQTKLRRNE